MAFYRLIFRWKPTTYSKFYGLGLSRFTPGIHHFGQQFWLLSCTQNRYAMSACLCALSHLCGRADTTQGDEWYIKIGHLIA
jgi:hypothetical protein